MDASLILHGPFRCIVNTATQLASKIKPVFEYEERKVGGPAHDTVFEARCFASSKLDELAGLIVVQEARAGSILSLIHI